MKHTKKILIIVMLLIFADAVSASTVDISVATDKPTYQLGETVKILVTAYNPNPQAVTLTFAPSPQATYLMDNTFEYPNGLGTEWSSRLIDPYNSYTWNFFHTPEMTVYTLDIGSHTVAGEVIGYGWSAPIQFEVTPEPCTLAILGLGLPFLRMFSRRKH